MNFNKFNDMDPYDKLERIGKLYKDGILTKMEFENEKSKILGTSFSNNTTIMNLNDKIDDTEIPTKPKKGENKQHTKVCPNCFKINEESNIKCSCGYYFNKTAREVEEEHNNDMLQKTRAKGKKIEFIFIQFILPIFVIGVIAYLLNIDTISKSGTAFAIGFLLSQTFLSYAIGSVISLIILFFYYQINNKWWNWYPLTVTLIGVIIMFLSLIGIQSAASG